MYKPEEFIVETIGKCKIPSPLNLSKEMGDGVFNYIKDDERVLLSASLKSYHQHKDNNKEPISFEKIKSLMAMKDI